MAKLMSSTKSCHSQLSFGDLSFVSLIVDGASSRTSEKIGEGFNRWRTVLYQYIHSILGIISPHNVLKKIEKTPQKTWSAFKKMNVHVCDS